MCWKTEQLPLLEASSQGRAGWGAGGQRAEPSKKVLMPCSVMHAGLCRDDMKYSDM